jgi:hypothetical protein
MREVSVCVGCVLGLVVLRWTLSGAFSSSTQEPAHALEVARLKVDAAGARAEADHLKAELEKCQAELKALKQKLAGLEQRPESPAKR